MVREVSINVCKKRDNLTAQLAEKFHCQRTSYTVSTVNCDFYRAG